MTTTLELLKKFAADETAHNIFCDEDLAGMVVEYHTEYGYNPAYTLDDVESYILTDLASVYAYDPHPQTLENLKVLGDMVNDQESGNVITVDGYGWYDSVPALSEFVTILQDCARCEVDFLENNYPEIIEQIAEYYGISLDELEG